MKLTKKGFLTIELIISSVMCATVAVLLIDLTMNLLSKTDDTYVSIDIETEKSFLLKGIKKNVEDSIKKHGKITGAYCESSRICGLTMNDNSRISISYTSNKLTIKDSTKTSEPLYERELNNNINDLKINISKNETYYLFNIDLINTFIDENNEISLLIYNG